MLNFLLGVYFVCSLVIEKVNHGVYCFCLVFKIKKIALQSSCLDIQIIAIELDNVQ